MWWDSPSLLRISSFGIICHYTDGRSTSLASRHLRIKDLKMLEYVLVVKSYCWVSGLRGEAKEVGKDDGLHPGSWKLEA